MGLNLQQGDILYVRGSGLLSDTIKLVDKGRYSHVAIALSPTRILEAQYYTKSQICDNYYDDYDVVRLPYTSEQRAKILDVAINLTGKRYDFMQDISYAERKLFHNKVANNPNELICSELVATFLIDLGVFERTQALIDSTPNELFKILEEYQKARGLAPIVS